MVVGTAAASGQCCYGNKVPVIFIFWNSGTYVIFIKVSLDPDIFFSLYIDKVGFFLNQALTKYVIPRSFNSLIQLIVNTFLH